MVSARPRRRQLLLWGLLAVGFLFVNFHRTATAVLADALAGTFDATGTELWLLHASFFYIYAALQPQPDWPSTGTGHGGSVPPLHRTELPVGPRCCTHRHLDVIEEGLVDRPELLLREFELGCGCDVGAD